jgi:hypothetical protein
MGGVSSMTLKTVELSDISDKVLPCKSRAISHSWDKLLNYDLGSAIARNSYAVLALRCERCGREKFIYLNRNGTRNGRPYYRNPVDYPRTHRFSDQEFMSELLSRSLFVHDLRRSNGRKR